MGLIIENEVSKIVNSMNIKLIGGGKGKILNANKIGLMVYKLFQRTDIDMREATKVLGKKLGEKLYSVGLNAKSIQTCMQALMSAPVVESFNSLREGVLQQLHDEFKTMETAWKNGKYRYDYYPREEVAKYAKDIVLFTEAEKKEYIKKVNSVFVDADKIWTEKGKTAPEVLYFINTKLAKIRKKLGDTAVERMQKESHKIVGKSKILQQISEIAMAKQYATELKGPSFKFGELPKELGKLTTKWGLPKKAIKVDYSGFVKPFKHHARLPPVKKPFPAPPVKEPFPIFRPSEVESIQRAIKKKEFWNALKKYGKVGIPAAVILGIAASIYFASEAYSKKK